jgi:mannose-6-phosphate isomerase-like protein (cupin superfamily)
MRRARNLILLLLAAAARSHGQAHDAAYGQAHDAVGACFGAPKEDVTHDREAFVEHEALALGELIKPFVFVDSDKDASLWKAPFVKTSRDGGQTTWKFDREPSTAADVLALLRAEGLSFVLRYEKLDVAEWPPALAALLPEDLKKELTADLAAGGTTVHLYLSAPGVSALSTHADMGDVLVLQLAGEKQWSFEDGELLTLAPGDMLWVPAGVRHSATSADDVSAHLTIHRVTE